MIPKLKKVPNEGKPKELNLFNPLKWKMQGDLLEVFLFYFYFYLKDLTVSMQKIISQSINQI